MKPLEKVRFLQGQLFSREIKFDLDSIMNPKILNDLRLFRQAALKIACAETSCYPTEYNKRLKKGLLKSPLDGHCSAVTFSVRGICGGDIVTGRINKIQHYWNRLPDGEEVDLTSCQFGGDGLKPLKKGRKIKPPKLVNPRFLMFAMKVLRQLDRK